VIIELFLLALTAEPLLWCAGDGGTRTPVPSEHRRSACPPRYTATSHTIVDTQVQQNSHPRRGRWQTRATRCLTLTVSPVYHNDRPPSTGDDQRDNSTCSRSRDMVGAHRNLNGSRDLTTPRSGMICRPWASTCYRQPITYKIWSLYLYLHSLQRYERRYKMSKMGCLG